MARAKDSASCPLECPGKFGGTGAEGAYDAAAQTRVVRKAGRHAIARTDDDGANKQLPSPGTFCTVSTGSGTSG